ncbi:hypothetical protein SK128_003824 [Halocaridina rubra]|uniref:Methyltransferase type 11 domain-containing protein n=1 Tax=Halocaridina rubra TaxID=373956 RepID=A0AAN8X1G5_HALRR
MRGCWVWFWADHRQYSDHFESVIGVDFTPAQLELARSRNPFANVTFKEGVAESLPVSDGSVDLVTSSMAVHWFNIPKFYAEVDRVLKPGGVLACYSYHVCAPLYKGKNLYSEFYEFWENLNRYWPKKYDPLKTEYTTIPSCYPEDLHLK